MSRKWKAPWLDGPLPIPQPVQTGPRIDRLRAELAEVDEVHRDVPWYAKKRREWLEYQIWEEEQKALAARAAGGGDE